MKTENLRVEFGGFTVTDEDPKAAAPSHSLDGVRDALDAVDCAYLGAYAAECETGLVNKFGVLDLASPDQCAYVDDDGCGGMAIPAVRKWDCLFDDNYELWQAGKGVDQIDAVESCAEVLARFSAVASSDEVV